MADRKLRVLVADDEPIVRGGIARLLEREDDVEVIGEAKHGREVIELVERFRPDLVFLDVQMPELDGLGALAALSEGVMPGIVFITAFSEYAVDAFEYHAIDYLLKPFDEDRFALALDRARERLAGRVSRRADVQALLRELGAGGQPLDRFLVKVGTKATVVSAADVEWLEAADNYVRLHTATGKHLVRITLKELEGKLDPHSFVRIHRSTMVNLTRVGEIRSQPTGDGEVILRSGARVGLSRRYRPEFERRFLS